MRHLLLPALLLAPAAPLHAAAELWRCVDAHGQVIWSDLGCKGPHSVHPMPRPGASGLTRIEDDGLDPSERQHLDALPPRRGGVAVRTRPASGSPACREAKAALAAALASRGAPSRARSATSQRRTLRRAMADACR